MKYFIVSFIALIVGLVFVSRASAGVIVRPRSNLPSALSDLDADLATCEAVFDDITPNTEKTIVWANPSSRNKLVQMFSIFV